MGFSRELGHAEASSSRRPEGARGDLADTAPGRSRRRPRAPHPRRPPPSPSRRRRRRASRPPGRRRAEWCRGSCEREISLPWASAFETWRWRTNHSKCSGNSVKTSSFSWTRRDLDDDALLLGVAGAFVADRRTFAARPPRPITRPGLSSATSTSSTTSPSISSTSLTWTWSGVSTSEGAFRNSSRSRNTARVPIDSMPLVRSRVGDRLRRPCALLQPVLRSVLVDHDEGWIGLRVVLADRLDRAAVPRRALVGDDNPPDRVLLAPDPAKSDSHGHAAAEVR